MVWQKTISFSIENYPTAKWHFFFHKLLKVTTMDQISEENQEDEFQKDVHHLRWANTFFISIIILYSRIIVFVWSKYVWVWEDHGNERTQKKKQNRNHRIYIMHSGVMETGGMRVNKINYRKMSSIWSRCLVIKRPHWKPFNEPSHNHSH